MVVDSSAFVAIVLEEDDAEYFEEKFAAAESILVSTVTVAEVSMVLLSRGGRVKVETFDALLKRLGAEIIPFSATQAGIALKAFDRFGKGRHPAKLNLGDCMTYALPNLLGEPLLFKGQDFSQTDIQIA